ncbi:hypothetical protein [Vibrio echinoideorum]|uniref:hypothetical protein n=1 Tax=Vibrio echinoideorum TaxID=2100116 RepID=UPI00354ED5CF
MTTKNQREILRQQSSIIKNSSLRQSKASQYGNTINALRNTGMSFTRISQAIEKVDGTKLSSELIRIYHHKISKKTKHITKKNNDTTLKSLNKKGLDRYQDDIVFLKTHEKLNNEQVLYWLLTFKHIDCHKDTLRRALKRWENNRLSLQNKRSRQNTI